MNVHILAKLLVPQRIKNTLLVFRTIRTGFPNANLLVYGNGINDVEGRNLLEATARSVGAQYVNIPKHPSGQWIENVMANEHGPFWICHTDMVFFDKVEHWFDGGEDLFAGRYEPEVWEGFSKTIHVARLHPSLMWFNPQPLRAAIRGYPGRGEFFNTVQLNLFQWSFVPQAGRDPLFYDVCAGLHHALGGTRFTEAQNVAYGHLFCGSYVDMISEQHPNLARCHDNVWNNLELARYLWKDQQEWYEENKVKI